MTGADPAASSEPSTPGASTPERSEVTARIEREQEHMPEGRPPSDAATRLSVGVAVFLLTLGALATLVTAYLVGGWDAMKIGVPAVLLYLLIGAIPYFFALASRVRSKQRVRDRLTRGEA